MKHAIWSTEDVDSICEDLLAEAKYNGEPVDEEDLRQQAYSLNEAYLDDERFNLGPLTGNPIVVIGDIGRWNGRATGYKVIDSGKVADCLYSDCDIASFYVEDGDFRCDETHHDGTNHLVFRRLKNGCGEDDIYDAVSCRSVDWETIDKVTSKLGSEIAGVYGWATA